ncbi:MAG: hypothetical protein WCC64_20365 [Aliidongia sp.]
MPDDNIVIDRNKRNRGVTIGSQLIDQSSFCRRWEGCVDNRVDGRAISRFFRTNDHVGTLSYPVPAMPIAVRPSPAFVGYRAA